MKTDTRISAKDIAENLLNELKRLRAQHETDAANIDRLRSKVRILQSRSDPMYERVRRLEHTLTRIASGTALDPMQEAYEALKR